MKEGDTAITGATELAWSDDQSEGARCTQPGAQRRPPGGRPGRGPRAGRTLPDPVWVVRSWHGPAGRTGNALMMACRSPS